MTTPEEAKTILRLAKGEYARAVELVVRQFEVLYARAQSLVGLSGIVVTVTGFSGRIIAATNPIAQILIVSGLAVVLFSAGWVFTRVMRIQWVTQDVSDDQEGSLVVMLKRRDAKTKAMNQGGILLFAGLLLYFLAISLMLFNPEPLQIPVR